jgi:hypothetical protein
MLVPSALRTACLAAFLLGCPGKEESNAPKPHDPSTGEPGVDTIRPAPPPPGNSSGNTAPLGNDETAHPHDPAHEEGAGSHEGRASGTTR